jgi:SAM-dependent methyltransferase
VNDADRADLAGSASPADRADPAAPTGSADPYAGFPEGFFARADERPDDQFYEPLRLVTHLDDRAIAAVGRLYEHLGIDGAAPEPRRVLDLMSSWISHFRTPPAELVALGMNAQELAANEAATGRVVHDLNESPALPFPDASFDAATCCVSVDYLVRPIEVFRETARVLRSGGVFALTFSNRCFPTKAIRGWLANDDTGHVAIVREYFRRSGGWDAPEAALCTAPGTPGDPLYAVWAARAV